MTKSKEELKSLKDFGQLTPDDIAEIKNWSGSDLEGLQKPILEKIIESNLLANEKFIPALLNIHEKKYADDEITLKDFLLEGDNSIISQLLKRTDAFAKKKIADLKIRYSDLDWGALSKPKPVAAPAPAQESEPTPAPIQQVPTQVQQTTLPAQPAQRPAPTTQRVAELKKEFRKIILTIKEKKKFDETDKVAFDNILTEDKMLINTEGCLLSGFKRHEGTEVDSHGLTVVSGLYVAALMDDKEFIEYLLGKGINLNIGDWKLFDVLFMVNNKKPWNIFDVLLDNRFQDRRGEVTELLNQNRSDPNAPTILDKIYVESIQYLSTSYNPEALSLIKQLLRLGAKAQLYQNEIVAAAQNTNMTVEPEIKFDPTLRAASLKQQYKQNTTSQPKKLPLRQKEIVQKSKISSNPKQEFRDLLNDILNKKTFEDGYKQKLDNLLAVDQSLIDIPIIPATRNSPNFLIKAISTNNIEVMFYLLEKKIKLRFRGHNAITYAIKIGKWELFDVLLEVKLENRREKVAEVLNESGELDKFYEENIKDKSENKSAIELLGKLAKLGGKAHKYAAEVNKLLGIEELVPASEPVIVPASEPVKPTVPAPEPVKPTVPAPAKSFILPGGLFALALLLIMLAVASFFIPPVAAFLGAAMPFVLTGLFAAGVVSAVAGGVVLYKNQNPMPPVMNGVNSASPNNTNLEVGSKPIAKTPETVKPQGYKDKQATPPAIPTAISSPQIPDASKKVEQQSQTK